MWNKQAHVHLNEWQGSKIFSRNMKEYRREWINKIDMSWDRCVDMIVRGNRFEMEGFSRENCVLVFVVYLSKICWRGQCINIIAKSTFFHPTTDRKLHLLLLEIPWKRFLITQREKNVVNYEQVDREIFLEKFSRDLRSLRRRNWMSTNNATTDDLLCFQVVNTGNFHDQFLFVAMSTCLIFRCFSWICYHGRNVICLCSSIYFVENSHITFFCTNHLKVQRNVLFCRQNPFNCRRRKNVLFLL